MAKLYCLMGISLLYLALGLLFVRRAKQWLGWLFLCLGSFAFVYGGLQILSLGTQHKEVKIDPKLDAARLGLVNLQQGLQRYRIDLGLYPTSEQGLRALLINPGRSKWKGPYLDTDELLDPWQMPYVYRSDGYHYTLSSIGPDRLPDTSDDLVFNDPGRR